MNGVQLHMKMKRAFFDSEKVKRAVDAQTRRSLSKSLSYVRTRLRSTYRRRKRPSRPGQAPSVYSKNPIATLKAVWFAYDARTKSGVVGAIKLNRQKSTVKGRTALPGLLEAGGMVRIPEESWDGKKWFTQRKGGRKRSSRGKKKRIRTVRIAARPAASVALKKEIDKGNIASPWANVVTG